VYSIAEDVWSALPMESARARTPGKLRIDWGQRLDNGALLTDPRYAAAGWTRVGVLTDDRSTWRQTKASTHLGCVPRTRARPSWGKAVGIFAPETDQEKHNYGADHRTLEW